MSKRNPIMNSDSYKVTHYRQIPENTRFASAYLESRGGAYDFTLFNGLQPILDQLKAPSLKQVRRSEERLKLHGLEMNKAWYDIAEMGFLPLRVSAVPEGLVIPTGNVLLQVENTDDRFAWLTMYPEAPLQRVWYPTTVATRSKFIKNTIQFYIDKTSDVPEQLDFKLHDFSPRGVSSYETAQIGGTAHMINFKGSDNLAALDFAEEYYSETMAGFSINAAEHFTVTSWGKENESKFVVQHIKNFAGEGKLYAAPIDSYDAENFVNNIMGVELKDLILSSGGTFVARPDSGEPVSMVMMVLRSLANSFGTTVNSKGYKVLNPAVRVVYGDGINEKTIAAILAAMEEEGFAVDNITFGMGGGLLQEVSRDTLKFAYKCNAIKRDEWWEDVSKNPKSDPNKKSKAGRLALIRDEATKEWKTVREHETNGQKNYLEEVFVNGRVTRNQTLAEIRTLSMN